MTKSVTTWKPLSEAFAHVLQYEQLDLLTQHRLRRVLADGRVHARSRYMFLPNMRSGQRERTDEPLPEKFWIFEGLLGSDIEVTWEADVNWQESRASLKQESRASFQGAHPLGACEAYRIEVDQDELFAIWPERSAPTNATKRSSAGRPPEYDLDAVLIEAAAEATANGLPKTPAEFRAKIKAKLGDRAPKNTRLKQLLDPFFWSTKQKLDAD
jgi:hypothetical protein